MPTNKRLVFSEGHFIATLLGNKKITLRHYRPGSHDFACGEVFYGEFPERIAMLLRATADTAFVCARDIPDDVAQEDGYTGGEHAFQSLKLYYPELIGSSQVAIIRYGFLIHDGDPLIKCLPNA